MALSAGFRLGCHLGSLIGVFDCLCLVKDPIDCLLAGIQTSACEAPGMSVEWIWVGVCVRVGFLEAFFTISLVVIFV